MINWFNMKKKTLPCQVLENKEDIETLKGYVKEAYKTTEELTRQTTSVALNTTNIGEATSGWIISPNGLLFKIVGIVEGIVNILFYADILGPTGPANTLDIGSVVSGEEAGASISGEAPNQTLNLILPRGEKGDTGATGPANTLNIGSVVSGDQASASITGDAPNQTLNLTLPKGEKGDGFNFMGSWVSGNEYYKDDVVTYQLGENQVASYVLIAESLIGSTTPPNQDTRNWSLIVSAPNSNTETLLKPNLAILGGDDPALTFTERTSADRYLKNMPYWAEAPYTTYPRLLDFYNYLKSNIKQDGRIYGIVMYTGSTSNTLYKGFLQGLLGSQFRIVICGANNVNNFIIDLFYNKATIYTENQNMLLFGRMQSLWIYQISGALAESSKTININLPIIEAQSLSNVTEPGGYNKGVVLSFSGGQTTITKANYPKLFALLEKLNELINDGQIIYNKEYSCNIKLSQYQFRPGTLRITHSDYGGIVDYLLIKVLEGRLDEGFTRMDFYISGGIARVVQQETFENYGGFRFSTCDTLANFDGDYPLLDIITK